MSGKRLKKQKICGWIWKEQETQRTGRHLSATMSENASNKSWKTFGCSKKSCDPDHRSCCWLRKESTLYLWKVIVKSGGICWTVHRTWEHHGHLLFRHTKAKFWCYLDLLKMPCCCCCFFKEASGTHGEHEPEMWLMEQSYSASRSWIMEFGTNMQMWTLA